MARSHFPLVLLLTVLLTTVSCQDTGLPVGGEPVERVVSKGNAVSLSYEVNGDEPVRISINSSQVDLSHRLLVAVRHGGRIMSFTLPYVEAGHAYSQVQRTLCSEVPSHELLIDVSSYNSTGSVSRNISFTISTFYVTSYKLRLGSSNSVLVAPPSPVVYEFDFSDHSGVDHFLVKVTSHDQGSTICSITSVQDGLCPVDQILDNPEHRGTFQTMLQLSAINIKRPQVGSKVYVVLSVLPTDSECLGSSRNLVDGLVMVNLTANYHPIFNNSVSERVKNITITVERALPAYKYWIAAVVLVVVFALFYILTILWIFVADYLLYEKNPAHELIQKITDEIDRKQERREEEVEIEEEVDFPETAVGRHKNRRRRRRRKSSTRSAGGRLVKRPSLMSVLGGRHWSDELEKMTPACSQQQDIAGRFTQALRHESKPVPITLPPVYSTTQSLPVGMITAVSQPDRRVPSDPGLNTTNSSTSVLNTTSSSTSDVDMRVTTPERQSEKEEVEGLTKTTSWPNHKRTNSMETAIKEHSIENIATTHASNGRIPALVLSADPGQSASEAESPQEKDALTISSPIHDQVKVVVTELNVLRLPKTLDQLSFAEGRQFQQKYRGYWAFVSTITLFYAIPAFQLVLTYQKFLNQSGNEDLCYYNSLCSHPLGIMSSFNNIWSNIGFVFLGFLYITVAYRRRQTYRFYETVNEGYEANGWEKVGVPQHFGIYYAMGVALVGEGFLSAAYHICPSSNNYQFDTTMMFVLIGLGLYKLYECRNPDNVPHTHWLLFVLSLLILLIGVGVLYPGNLGFYIVFFIIFECAVVLFSIENYYRWKLNFWKIGNIKVLLSEVRTIVKHPWPPQHKGKFVYVILSNLVNFFFALSCVIYQPEDFATFFLYIMIGNFVLSLAYYAVMKLCLREYRHEQILYSLLPLVLFVISIPFWAGGIAMYASYVTNWLESPATSRNSNANCVLFEFYDTHDLWHCLTAFAMFFSFLMLMTLDDDQEYKVRKKLHLF